jgi:hypothetical protein
MASLVVIALSSTTHDVLYQSSFSISLGETFHADLSDLNRYGFISLRLTAQFAPGIGVAAEADIRKVESIDVHHPTEKLLQVDVKHEEEENRAAVVAYMKPTHGNQQNCSLHCPATGKRSGGPCIDCSDGDYTIRLCC